MSFDVSLIFSALPKMLMGIGLTFQLLVLSGVLGLALAIVLMLMRVSGKWYLDWLAQAYIYVFRGTPILVQIFIVYYGFPQLEFIREGILWPIFRDPFGCAIVALTLNTGAYVSEILRGGVLGVRGAGPQSPSAVHLSDHPHRRTTGPAGLWQRRDQSAEIHRTGQHDHAGGHDGDCADHRGANLCSL